MPKTYCTSLTHWAVVSETYTQEWSHGNEAFDRGKPFGRLPQGLSRCYCNRFGHADSRELDSRELDTHLVCACPTPSLQVVDGGRSLDTHHVRAALPSPVRHLDTHFVQLSGPSLGTNTLRPRGGCPYRWVPNRSKQQSGNVQATVCCVVLAGACIADEPRSNRPVGLSKVMGVQTSERVVGVQTSGAQTSGEAGCPNERSRSIAQPTAEQWHRSHSPPPLIFGCRRSRVFVQIGLGGLLGPFAVPREGQLLERN